MLKKTDRPRRGQQPGPSTARRQAASNPRAIAASVADGGYGLSYTASRRGADLIALRELLPGKSPFARPFHSKDASLSTLPAHLESCKGNDP